MGEHDHRPPGREPERSVPREAPPRDDRGHFQRSTSSPAPEPAPPQAPLRTTEPAPLPSLDALEVPAHVPFTYEGATPLSPSDRDVITTFHEHYMQGGGLTASLAGLPRQEAVRRVRQAKQEAEYVLPLMQRQYEEAVRGVDGPNTQEAQQVKRNLEWVQQLLAMPA